MQEFPLPLNNLSFVYSSIQLGGTIYQKLNLLDFQKLNLVSLWMGAYKKNQESIMDGLKIIVEKAIAKCFCAVAKNLIYEVIQSSA